MHADYNTILPRYNGITISDLGRFKGTSIFRCRFYNYLIISSLYLTWYKEINNNSECNKKKKVVNCTDYLLIFIDFSCCLY